MKNIVVDPFKSESKNELVEKFWIQRINFEDSELNIDRFPFLIMKNTPMSKIHFLFIMLGIT